MYNRQKIFTYRSINALFETWVNKYYGDGNDNDDDVDDDILEKFNIEFS